MNQWFLKEGYTKDQVESIQLEIRKEGFRDLHHNIEKTAGILIEALSQEALIPVIPEETVADEHLVEVAFTHLQGIFAKHIHEAMLHAGRYLVRTFYGSYENAKKNNKIRKESLHQLIQKLSEASGKAPKKTWIYDAVKLAVDDHHFRSTKFRLYGNIGHSHKVLLTRVPEITRKKRLVKEIAKANGVYTVEKLRQRIKETAKTNRVFITPENVPADETLEQQKRKKLEKLLGDLNRRITTRQNELVQYSADRKRVKKVIKSKPKDKRKPRKVGFRDWTDPACNVNIQTGCSNNCRYCYAKTQAYRREQVALGSWADQIIRRHDFDKHRNLYHGLVGFPSTHDITPDNLDDYLYVLEKLLRAGNEVLIVSKPRLDCIKAICDACRFFKDKIFFRFTIGAMDNDILRFWEPNAPTYEERKECLEYAYDKDFRTSVSMEPLLAINQADQMIADLYFSVSEDIWIGPMNHINAMKKDADNVLMSEIEKIEAGQTPEDLQDLHDSYKGDPLIKWKTKALKILNVRQG
jgi:DNA repair photolyase